jgi:hypothetical protein
MKWRRPRAASPIGWEDDPGRIPTACMAVWSFFAFCNRLQFAVQQNSAAMDVNG